MRLPHQVPAPETYASCWAPLKVPDSTRRTECDQHHYGDCPNREPITTAKVVAGRPNSRLQRGELRRPTWHPLAGVTARLWKRFGGGGAQPPSAATLVRRHTRFRCSRGVRRRPPAASRDRRSVLQ